MVSAEPKAQTKIREGRDDAGNPGPVYGQKDQAPTQGYKEPSKATDKEEPRYADTANNTGQTNNQGGNQKTERAPGEIGTERGGRGEGPHRPTQAHRQKGRDKR